MLLADAAPGDFVLSVHGDLMLLATLHSLLQERGYKVVSSSSPDEALLHCRESPRARVVIAALSFEGSSMTGADLAESVRKLCPTSVILTGDYEDSLLWRIRGFADYRYLQQPLIARLVLEAVSLAWGGDRAREDRPPDEETSRDRRPKWGAGCLQYPQLAPARL